MDINSLRIHKSKSLLESLDVLNEISYQSDIGRLILFVENDDHSVLGTITDGDIRRALLKYKNLHLRIGNICNPDFVFEWDTNNYINLFEYRKNDIKIIPILDRERKLVDIIDLSKQQAFLPMECVIMAGGRGKRLSPLTDNIPKPMLPLGNKPIIEHNIDRLIRFGIKKIYISVKYLGEQIVKYFGDGSSKGISIEYIWEDNPLGTGGALSLVNSYETEHLLVMNSDLFTDVDFEDLFLKLKNHDADMVVASTEYKVDVPFAVFETDNNVVKRFKEKPSYIYQSNAGVYLMKTELVKKIPQNQFYNITDLMEDVVNSNGKLIYDAILGYWIDIGTPNDYKRAQDFVKHFESE